jgi:hypothetical protein
VQGLPLKVHGAFIAIFCFLGAFAAAEEATPTTTVVISVAEQKLVLLRDGGLVKKYPISTSKFGLGDSFGSYKTPLGKLRVCQKVGDDLSMGAVLKERHATGEVLPPNSPGRDPIVTRILWLEGLEAQNEHARSRGIYIHGTTEESKIGQPVSYGCIRMRSKDVVELFDEVPLDAQVAIIGEKFPRYAKYTPQKPKVIAAASPTKPTPTTPAPSVSAEKKIAASTPAPHIALKLSPVPSTPTETRVAPEVPTTASLALKGSMLDAGLPQGPKIPTLPAPPEPKDVARFTPTSPGLSSESPFSLHGIARDLSAGTRTAELDAIAREAETKTERPEAEPEAPQPASRIALRAAKANVKPKP